VNTRNRDGFHEIEPYLRRIVAPALSGYPEGVLIDDVFWGDIAAHFAWNGASRPRTRILKMGAEESAAFDRAAAAVEHPEALKTARSLSPTPPAAGGLISGGSAAAPGAQRLRDLSPDELSDLIALTIGRTEIPADKKSKLILEADALVREEGFRAELAAARDAAEEVNLLMRRLRERAPAEAALLPMGAGDWLAGVGDRLRETLRRTVELPAYVLSAAIAELRGPLNQFISVFLGDVFAYLNNRGDASAPGPIVMRLLEKLESAHAEKRTRLEPIVVLSHSMGGQVVYDAVTYFLPQIPRFHEIRVDFWSATASQVGLFEELKLFRASSPQYLEGKPVPFPAANLGVWWNVWDYNDFVSYTAKDIVDKNLDESFDSGMNLLTAHGGYLKCPSFYRKFAEKLGDAAFRGWRTT
jgi:hypothetical protein